MVKELDDLAFAGHQGITIEELSQVIQKGAIILGWNQEDELIAESQVIFSKIDGCADFPEDAAYCYGTAIHPNYQSQGLGLTMAQEQERCARENGCSKLYMTIRVENYPSISMRMKMGSLITGYDPLYYGDNPKSDARLIVSKDLKMSRSSTVFSNDVLVPVAFGCNYDASTHNRVQKLVSEGYVGYKISREGITFGRLGS